MKVSIIIVSYYHPEIIEKCVHTLQITENVDYEVIVVDNGSDEATQTKFAAWQEEGLIDKRVEPGQNLFFSAGNNLGVANSNPESEYILLLNSDVAFKRPDWLAKQIAWMEGTAKHEPTIWDLHPTQPAPGPYDIISIGWSHDANVDGNVRPEGWCCMFRRTVWRDLSPDFPFHYGFEEAVALSVRAGAKCGVLFNYAPYLVHAEQGSGKTKAGNIVNAREPDMPAWFSGLHIESLDFTLGPNEHQSYLQW